MCSRPGGPGNRMRRRWIGRIGWIAVLRDCVPPGEPVFGWELWGFEGVNHGSGKMEFTLIVLLAVLACIATEWLYRRMGIWRDRQ